MNIKYSDFLFESNLNGKRVRLILMVDDPLPIEPGTEGTIRGVDSTGTLLVKWDNGRTLGIIPEVDKYIILNDEEN